MTALSKLNANTQRADALTALDALAGVRIFAMAKVFAQRSGLEAEDLRQHAFLRWMKSTVPIISPAETEKFLIGAMRSIASNKNRNRKVEREVLGERAFSDGVDDPLERAPDLSAPADSLVFAQQLIDLIDDDEVKDLVLGLSVDQTKAEIMKQFGWDSAKYEAVYKRKVRFAAKLLMQGKFK